MFTCIQLVTDSGKASESKLNVNKTCVLLCGSLKNYQPNANVKMKFIYDKIKMLGVHLGNVNVNDYNFAPIVNSIRKLFGLWSNRNLSIFGKSVVVNILILSKLWYVANIFSVPDQIVKDINQNISKFIWGIHRHIVNSHVLMLPRVEAE